MDARHGVPQRRLQRLWVNWGPQRRQHMAMVPVFNSGYRVLGLVGLDPTGAPLWYPGVPLALTRTELTFRSSLSDAPPGWGQVPAGLLDGVYFYDPWGAILAMVPHTTGAPSLSDAVNLASCLVDGARVSDVLFEPTLHRVRAMMLQRRLRRPRATSVLRLPALAQSVEKNVLPTLDITALGPPPDRPKTWFGRITDAFARMAMVALGRKR